jgi:hypothetical protein
VIVNLFSNIPSNEKSHLYGWAKHWSECLNVPIDFKFTQPHKALYIDHGVNFGGNLNLFGGANKDVYDKLNNLLQSDRILSLDRKMPEYGKMLYKRIGAKTTYHLIDENFCAALTNKLKNIETLTQENLLTSRVTVGDSHTIAYAAKGDSVFYNPGLTLYGALNNGLESLLRGTSPSIVNFCLGSIDIRHHILRHDTDIHAMIKEYVKQGNDIAKKYSCQVTYSYPVPIEYEGRKVPKTGFYKNTAFFGTRNARVELVKNFCDILYSESNGAVVSPPQHWYDMDGEAYAKEIMELSSSVHIAPKHYRRHGGWDV